MVEGRWVVVREVGGMVGGEGKGGERDQCKASCMPTNTHTLPLPPPNPPSVRPSSYATYHWCHGDGDRERVDEVLAVAVMPKLRPQEKEDGHRKLAGC